MRVSVVRVLLAAVLLRALIPIGFMPDLSGLSSGELKIVICKAGGSEVLIVNDDGSPANHDASGHGDGPCAFAGIAAATPADLPGIVTPTFDVRSRQSLPLLAVVLPQVRAGPPLGSRAPPQIS